MKLLYKFILCAFITIISTQGSFSQNTLDNAGLTASTPAVSAYSLRKLSSSYSGNAIQVRRSSDNATQDIGFSGGNLDTASLKTFVGSGNGFVSIWYDQSGNGRNLTQATTSRQPSIINAGVIYRRNFKPTTFYDASDDGMGYSGSDYLTSNPLSVNIVAGSNSSSTAARRAVQGTSNWLIGPYNNYHSWYANGWNHLINTQWSTTLAEIFTITQPSSGSCTSWRNGVSQPTTNNNGTPNKIQTGTEGAYAEVLDGYISEVVTFNSLLGTTDRQNLEANQTTYYSSAVLSTDATLSALSTTAGTLTPTFAAATTAYTASVTNATTSVTVTPTKTDANATIQVQVNSGGYATVTSGSASSALSLNVGTNTIDVKVTAQDGNTIKTYTITVTRAAAVGNALHFDGTDDRVSITDNANLRLSGGSFTIEYWAKPTAVDGNFRWVVSKDNGNGDLDYLIGLNTSNQWRFIARNLNVDILGTTTAVSGTWYHVACVFNGTTATLYVNGVAEGTDNTIGSAVTNTANVLIGGRTASGPGQFYAGAVDDLRFWNTARTVGQISASMNSELVGNESGLVAYYKFNQGTASGTNTGVTTLTDGTSNSYNGTLGSFFALTGGTSNWVAGNVGAAVASTDATLSALTTTAGTISPTFASATTAYTASVTNATTSVTVTPTKTDANATITVNGTAVTSGSASGAIALSVGSNTITVVVTAQDGTTTKTYTITVTRASAAAATGGTVTTSGAYTIHTFTSSGTFTPTGSMNVEVLVVAGGGGGGGSNGGGGGGAGGLVYASSYAVTAGAKTVTIGNGGAANSSGTGVSGQNSVFDAITAIGGGGGAACCSVAGVSGGSGGGQGRDDFSNIAPGSSTQGNSGGGIGFGNSGGTFSNNGATGGGGAGGAGGNSSGDGNNTGFGGVGKQYTQFAHAGSPAGWFAGGGGGSIYNGSTQNAGGQGGGGKGTNNAGLAATSGAANTGGGGGGGSSAGWGSAAGDGGSGIVIIRYLTAATSSDATLSALTTTAGTISPTFASATTAYTASVTNATTSVTVTPTKTDANATITVNGTAVTSGSASGAIALSVGSNTITVVVTAQDGTTTKTYTITVTRAAGIPTITSFSPIAGNVGSTVTITGTNFNTTAANNIVFFGATKAIVSAATATSLTVTVPAGATFGNIKVTNSISNLTAVSLGKFTPTYTQVKQSYSASDFSSAQSFATNASSSGQYQNKTSIGDIDGDGKADLVIANNSGNTLSILLNTGSSGSINFASKVDITTVDNPTAAGLGDVDGDGKLDIVVCGRSGGTLVHVLINTSTSGSVSFASPIVITASFRLNYDAQLSDFDGDGKLDLIYTMGIANQLAVHLNTSTGLGASNVSFSATPLLLTGGNGNLSLSFGDLDGDGKVDVVAPLINANTVGIFRNTSTPGTLSFVKNASDLTSTNASVGLELADFDGDGKLDLVCGSISGSIITVFMNTSTSGTISFASAQNFTTPSNYGVSVADINGDGKVDIATSAGGILLNTSISGTISFATSFSLTGTSNPLSNSMGDLDGDGKPDLVIANSNSTISAYRNNPLSNNADLSALTLSSGTLSPVFAAATTAYTASVANATTSITVTPTRNQANATIQARVNGGSYTSVTSGSPSGSLLLNVGSNTIDVKVTAQDGTTTKTYTITVTRAAAAVPPTITSFSPISGNVGSSVTITGTGFNTTAANNIVFFGATKATVTGTPTATSMTVTVPVSASYAPITILNKSSVLAATSSLRFNPIFTPSKGTLAAADFASVLTVTPTSSSNTVGAGACDFDGDGKPELVVCNYGNTTLSVLLNTSSSGSISFGTQLNLVAGSATRGIALTDVDGDGKPDIIAVGSGNDKVSIYLNTSTGTGVVSFAAKVDFTMSGNGGGGVVVGDLDGDGKPDIAAANGNNISVFLNNCSVGSVSFGAITNFAAPSFPVGLAIGDIDGDGKLDLVSGNYNSATTNASVFRNTTTSTGTVTFATRVDLASGSSTSNHLALGDLNGDGKLDIVLSNDNGHSISVFKNTSTINSVSFDGHQDFAANLAVNRLSIGDLDGDGKPDVVASAGASTNMSLFKNTSSASTISFSSRIDLNTGTGSFAAELADMDGDGKLDILYPNFGTSILVYRNLSLYPTWAGTTSTAWATASNWNTGMVPGASDNVIIPSGTTNAPTITNVQSLAGININSGATLTANNTLSVSGAFTNDGTVTGTGNVNLNGSSAQTIAGTGSIANLTLNNSTGATISSGNTSITGTLTLTSGTLTTGGFLTLKSDATGTARIAPVVGAISGNVTVERYIPPGKRSFRLLSPGVTTTNFIKGNWQEGANNTSLLYSSNQNPVAGYGTHITGSTTGTNGFDATSTGNPSLFQLNNSAQTWGAIANTNATNLTAGNAYRLLVRGNRSFDLSTTSTTNTATTLRATGTLLTGTMTFGSASSTPSSLPTLASGINQYSFIGNPYASPIDWNAVSKTELTGFYWIWDPTLATNGAYVSCSTTGVKSNGSSAVTTAIQPGQAFFVVNSSNVAARSLVITEANKTTGNTNVFRTQTGTSSMGIQLFLASNTATGTSQDGATVLFNSSYSNAVNDDDAGKFTNTEENIAIQRGSSVMSIEARDVPANPSDTVFLKAWQLTQNNYTLRVASANFDATMNAYLQDAYLNSETQLNLGGTTDVNFTTTSTAASMATDRFRIVFRANGALPVTVTNVKAFQKNTGVQVEWNTVNETNMAAYEVEKSTDAQTFTKAGTVAATGNSSYNWYDASPVNGNNYYRIKMVDKTGTFKYTQVVNVKIGGTKNTFTIVGNPIRNKTVTLQMENVEKGSYTVNLFNNLGQTIASKTINHAGGSATETIVLGNAAAGTYQLSVIGNNVKETKTIIVE